MVQMVLLQSKALGTFLQGSLQAQGLSVGGAPSLSFRAQTIASPFDLRYADDIFPHLSLFQLCPSRCCLGLPVVSGADVEKLNAALTLGCPCRHQGAVLARRHRRRHVCQSLVRVQRQACWGQSHRAAKLCRQRPARKGVHAISSIISCRSLVSQTPASAALVSPSLRHCCASEGDLTASSYNLCTLARPLRDVQAGASRAFAGQSLCGHPVLMWHCTTLAAVVGNLVLHLFAPLLPSLLPSSCQQSSASSCGTKACSQALSQLPIYVVSPPLKTSEKYLQPTVNSEPCTPQTKS